MLGIKWLIEKLSSRKQRSSAKKKVKDVPWDEHPDYEFTGYRPRPFPPNQEPEGAIASPPNRGTAAKK